MYSIEEQKLFSESRLWDIQRDYYQSSGIDAWRNGVVPHYITSNSFVGKTYAELVLSFLGDLSRKQEANKPVYILELGAGHGRLCYHFFKHFEKYYEEFSLPPICYILSDFVEENLSFWRTHPRLQPYINRGWIDFAHFDTESRDELYLQNSKIRIESQSLLQPLLVIANYFFDTIPQELFLIRDSKISDCLLSLSTERELSELDADELADALKYQYSYKEIVADHHPDNLILHHLLEQYRHLVVDTHLLFPHRGILCIERLRSLSKAGLVLFSADKGQHLLSWLDHCSVPHIEAHGSFSLPVNFHAFKEYCSQTGGYGMFSHNQHANINLNCMLFLTDHENFKGIKNCYDKFVNDYGPDDFFTLKLLIEKQIDNLSFPEIITAIRTSCYDSQMFLKTLPRINILSKDCSQNERWILLQTVIRIWDTYYPLGERTDLAFELGSVLYTFKFFEEALIYYQLSIQIYGRTSPTLYNIALTLCCIGDFQQVLPLITELQRDESIHEKLDELFLFFGGEERLPAR